ncbi:hypothetical protein I3760_09G020100 [Carya illinoinensis]|nr:hypothetical protein I3760_09G020100 [Carya illinoinensis]
MLEIESRMVGIADGVSFPVVFFDGEREMSIGHVVVHPSLEFKNFQSILSRKIGISPHQFSVYLAVKYRSETLRKIPITGKVNFAAISREKDCFFLVILKRSRRERKRRTRKEFQGDEYHASSMSVVQRRNKKVPENVMLLRRDAGTEGQPFPGYVSPIVDRNGYEKRVKELQMERERYLMNMGMSGLSLEKEDNGGVGERGVARNGVVDVECEECMRAKQKGDEVGFHGCVYDTVTVGFRSPAGPIARPVKGSS